MNGYGFLRKPRWIVLTIVVLSLVVLMINLGFWQLRRLHERQHTNAAITSAQASVEGPLASVLPPATALDATAAYEWRAVTATGTYDVARQVLVRNRSQDSLPGFHVVTPLDLGDGHALLVNRGFLPLAQENAPPLPASGTVTVVGRLRPTQTRGALGPRDPTEGTLAAVARVDIARIQQQTPQQLEPMYIELTGQEPAVSGGVPTAIPLPELDDGPHLAYAVQWFLFSALAVLGLMALARKTARTPGGERSRDQRRSRSAGKGLPDANFERSPTGTDANTAPMSDATPAGASSPDR